MNISAQCKVEAIIDSYPVIIFKTFPVLNIKVFCYIGKVTISREHKSLVIFDMNIGVQCTSAGIIDI